MNSSSGKLDPYVMINWDAVSFHSEQVAPLAFLRAFCSGTTRWPQTSHMSKTVNPHWKGEEIVLNLKKGKVKPGGKIFLAVVDYDKIMRRHDLLGTVVLNATDLISFMMACVPTLDSSGQIEERSFDFERQLVRDGVEAVQIKFTLCAKRKKAQAARHQGHPKRSAASLQSKNRRQNTSGVENPENSTTSSKQIVCSESRVAKTIMKGMLR